MPNRIGRNIAIAADPAGGSSYSTIGRVVDIDDLGGAKAEFADTSLLNDLYKTKKPVQLEADQVSFTVELDPTESTNESLVDMFEELDTCPTWRLTYADVGSGAVTETFSAWVAELGRKVTKGTMTMREVKLQINGNPGMTGA